MRVTTLGILRFMWSYSGGVIRRHDNADMARRMVRAYRLMQLIQRDASCFAVTTDA